MMPSRRRSSYRGDPLGYILELLVGMVAAVVALVWWVIRAVRLTRRHPLGVGIAVGGCLLFSMVAIAARSFQAGLVALLGYLVAAGAFLYWRRRRADEAAAVTAQRAAQRARTLRELLLLSPSEFEEQVAGLLRSEGYGNVRVVGGAGDLAADILAAAPDGHAVVVQCKRYSPHVPVRSPELQKFIGMAYQHHEADEAILVTTSHLTAHAQALADQHDIHVIDDHLLARWMERAALLRRPDVPSGSNPPVG